MMSLRSTRAKLVQERGQRGYVMLVILLMLALLTLAIVQAAPAVATDIQRQQEEELIHRGDQYARAVRRFYHKFGRPPNSLDELKQTNNLRFLRREYKDPITGGDFKLLHVTDIKFQPKGFFGKSPTNGGSGSGGGGLFNAPSPGGQNTQLGGQDTASSGSQDKPTDQSAAKPDSSGSKPSSNGFDPGKVLGGGGGPIVGVSSTSTKTSIIELDGKNHYDEWQFFYVPQMEQGQMFPQNNPRTNPKTSNK